MKGKFPAFQPVTILTHTIHVMERIKPHFRKTDCGNVNWVQVKIYGHGNATTDSTVESQ
jgi:hypothetical protein